MHARLALAGIVMALVLPLVAYAAAININTADATLLDTLPGIGPTKAAAIVAYRGAHGPFTHAADIQEVSGIGPATFAKLSALIMVGPTSPEATQATLQPPPASASSPVVKAITSPSASAHAPHAVSAPTVVEESAAVGAAATATAPPPAVPAPISSGHSTWLIGLLAIVAFAGGAFMIL